MDELDKAKELEIQHREDSLKEARSKLDHSPGEQAVIIDGVTYCIDCCEPIPLKRLAVKPDALRCVECKEHWENKNK